MEHIKVDYFPYPVSRLGIGTWAMGGDLWGEADEAESIRTLREAFELGINVIDTAHGYGSGLSETVVGKALKGVDRERIFVATKGGLNLRDRYKVFRDSSREWLEEELAGSLKRLGVDYIDLYQIHWPDPTVPQEEVAETLGRMRESGKIRAIGLSNYSVEQIEAFSKVVKVQAVQFPFNIFEQEDTVLKYARKEGLTTIGYSSLCRGLLTGTLKEGMVFETLRGEFDPKFREPYFSQYLACAAKLGAWAKEKHGISLTALAVRWSLDKGIQIPLWGARHPRQLDPIREIFGWRLSEADFHEIDAILTDWISHPIGPQYMAPPLREK